MKEAMAKVDEDEFHDVETTKGYKAPAEKSITEIMNTDPDDESLQRYKEKLLKGASASDAIVLFPYNPARVVLKRSTLMVEGRDEIEVELNSELSKRKENAMILKEGAIYRVKLEFYVQREIVHGLKYVRHTYRKGIRVDKVELMLGSYGPQMELVTYIGPEEDTPTGVLFRGTYMVKTVLIDDDKNKHLQWEGCLEVKKDWN